MKSVPLKVSDGELGALSKHAEAARELLVSQADHSNVPEIIAICQPKKQPFSYKRVVLSLSIHHKRRGEGVRVHLVPLKLVDTSASAVARHAWALMNESVVVALSLR